MILVLFINLSVVQRANNLNFIDKLSNNDKITHHESKIRVIHAPLITSITMIL